MSGISQHQPAEDARRGSTHLDELVRVATEDPGRPVLEFAEVVHSASAVFDWTERTARGLLALGVQRGDRVVIMLPNCLESIWTWFGSTRCGAIDAPISPETRGALLEYYLKDLDPRVVVGRPIDLERIAETGWTPETAVVVGEWDGSYVFAAGTRHVAYGDLVGMGAGAELPTIGPDSTGTIIYTSGTTGPSKGVMLSVGYWMEMALNHSQTYPFHFPPGWVYYVVQPFCHIDARSILIHCLVGAGKFVMGERFSASQFWTEVEEHDADVFNYIGTMLHLMFKQPALATEGSRLRYATGSSAPTAIHQAFEQRFNVRLIEGYGMTEFPFVSSQTADSDTPGSIGWIVDGVEGQVVDDTDRPVPAGVLGELVVRPTRPHVMMQGYWRKPEATVEAFRNLWFHTGDLMRMFEDGHLEYVGRKKDSIRRRGENVSAWEVEQITTSLSEVKEAAAFGVPAAVGEEDVALLVVPATPGAVLDLVALREYLGRNLPRFAVPRFIETVDGLPKTPSERIAKGKVRERGLTEAAYDAEANVGSVADRPT